MQTIKIQVEDSFYDDIISSGVNIQSELKKMMEKIVYQKEYQIANKIKQGLEEVEEYKSGNLELIDAKDFLSELKSEY